MLFRSCLSAADEAAHLKALRHLPAALQAVLTLEPQIISWASQFASKENALFLGRGLHYPIAQEGALKLKEISYIHAEAYAAIISVGIKQFQAKGCLQSRILCV